MVNARNNLFAVFFLFQLSIFAALYSENSISEQIHALKSDNSKAVQLCTDWLKENCNHPDYPEVVKLYFDLEENLTTLLAELPQKIVCIKDDEQKGILYWRLAETSELIGRMALAQQYYTKAAHLLTSYAGMGLLNSARLLYAMGLAQEAAQTLNQISQEDQDNEIIAAKYLLLAVINMANREYPKATAYFELILKEFSETNSVSTAILYYLNLLTQTGEIEHLSELKQKWEEKYPTSPEYLLSVSESNIDLSFIPYNLINPLNLTPVVTPVSMATSSQIQNVSINTREDIFIQTGSFTVKENADYMLRDLKKKQFTAFIREKILDNKKYYTVIASIPESYSDADTFLQELLANGFNGFKIRIISDPYIPSE